MHSDGMQQLIQDHCSALAAQVLATVNGNNAVARAAKLTHVATWLGLMKALSGRTDMHVREQDFDADPNLLNTPASVVDLRTSLLMPHSPSYLMRHMTSVAPDYSLWERCLAGDAPESFMPMFAKLLDNTARVVGNPLADEPGELRPDYIVVNGRWIGYSFSGWMNHQHMMFVHGGPGIGKSQIFEIILALQGSYGIGPARPLPRKVRGRQALRPYAARG